MLSPSRSFAAVLVLLSCLGFYLSTVPVTQAVQAGLGVTSQDFTFVRFAFGAMVTLPIWISFRRSKLKNIKALIFRGLFNYLAVWCFFRCSALSGPALANVLNLTYPVFGVLLAIAMRAEYQLKTKLLCSVIAFIGIVLVLDPTHATYSTEAALWGLASGVFAAFSIKSLSLSREGNDTFTVLTSMFFVGTVLAFFIDGVPQSGVFNGAATPLLFSAFAGVAGQFCLTAGARVLAATEVGILSTMRLIFALVFSGLLGLDEELSLFGYFGAVLIFAANIGLIVATRSSKKSETIVTQQ